MKLRHLLLPAVFALFTSPAFAASPLMEDARAMFEPIPQDPPALPGNPASAEKVTLGKALYFDPRLSASQTISCNSCHGVGMGGVDMVETSTGHRGLKGLRNSPTVLNAVFNFVQFWDGRSPDLEDQAGGPMINPVEMASTHENVVKTLQSIPGYAPMFAAAFPDQNEPINIDNVKKAIAVFEASLITPNAPFDLYLAGDEESLSAEQKEGLQLFMDNGCTACHSGRNIGGQMYSAFGMVEDPSEDVYPSVDKGRYDITGDDMDLNVFKVPTLRNIVLTLPYFHAGTVWDLGEAVDIMARSQMGIELSEQEIDRIVAFLGSLTGEQPQITYPVLPPSVADTPRPKP